MESVHLCRVSFGHEVGSEYPCTNCAQKRLDQMGRCTGLHSILSILLCCTLYLDLALMMPTTGRVCPVRLTVVAVSPPLVRAASATTVELRTTLTSVPATVYQVSYSSSSSTSCAAALPHYITNTPATTPDTPQTRRQQTIMDLSPFENLPMSCPASSTTSSCRRITCTLHSHQIALFPAPVARELERATSRACLHSYYY